MLAGASTDGGGEAARKADLAQRKTAFTAGSYIWGIQARTLVMSVFLAPSATRSGYFDLAQISGLLGLRRMRSSVACPIRYGNRTTDDDVEIGQPVREPLEGDGSDRPPLLERFCSQPPPRDPSTATAGGLVRG